MKEVPDAGPLACSPGGPSSSGLAGTQTLGALSAAEQATFCDWAAAATGGYGCTTKCDGGFDGHVRAHSRVP